uniref:Leucine-rich repeat protein n=1 Tax=viral metagenome TaxID=1070528 RepID=A0A6C0EHU1_9ZZZZ
MEIKYKFNNDTNVYIANSMNEVLELDTEKYNNIIYLDCYNCELTKLPVLPDSLRQLYCNNNKLLVLPTLANGLQTLYCYDNLLCCLPRIPKSLRYLHCGVNRLTFLPTLPENLQCIYCYENLFNIFPRLPNNLNPSIEVTKAVAHYIEKCGDKEKYHIENTIAANKIRDWFTDCKYNPKYKYCRDRVNKDYDELMSG